MGTSRKESLESLNTSFMEKLKLRQPGMSAPLDFIVDSDAPLPGKNDNLLLHLNLPVRTHLPGYKIQGMNCQI